MKLDGRIIVWPKNFDSSRSRHNGRKIPKGQGIGQPKLPEIERAAQALSLKAEAIPGKSPPSAWWEKTGYLIIERHGKRRSMLLKELAKEMLQLRREEAAKENPRQPPPHR